MDPEIAWGEFTLALLEGRPMDAREYGEALHEWLSKGGFIPKAMSQFNEGKSRQDLIDWIGCYV
mgnify:FL=1|tara:strand:+ start:1381 stop:1572 length:192 start_codon:yes stop_codon:yes gene_type:complete